MDNDSNFVSVKSFALDSQHDCASLERKDVLRITNAYHQNPDNPEEYEKNGHIRFSYRIYMKQQGVVQRGCIRVFPMDNQGNGFIYVRCIEDTIDIFYSEDTPSVSLTKRVGEGGTEGKEARIVAEKNGDMIRVRRI